MQFPSPTHYVDITATVETKKAACYAHASQTPDRYYELQDSVAIFRGLESGTKRAEAYIAQRGNFQDIFPRILASEASVQARRNTNVGCFAKRFAVIT
jgi:LmbE family N-acetylglucosaminyl deacetylase